MQIFHPKNRMYCFLSFRRFFFYKLNFMDEELKKCEFF